MAMPTRRTGPAPPLHPGFINSGGTLLIAAFLTDLMYWHSAVWQWANFSAWLITAGLVMALAATLVLIADFLTGRARRLRWPAFAVVAAAALLSLVNVFVHSRDAWSSVVPEGLILSAIVTLLLLVAAAMGWLVTLPDAALRGDGE